MIDEKATFEEYGYYSTDWKPKAHKLIVAVCDDCGSIRYPKKKDYRDLCHSCAMRTDECRRRKSEAHKDVPLDAEHRTSIGDGHRGKIVSDETRQRSSATQQGIPYEDWKGFATENLYCEKFDDACRERIREKYGRKCFLCNKLEADNDRKLSVHHFDMNKDAGCNGNLWKLVPLCMHCHGITHTPIWTTRIEYLLNNVYITTDTTPTKKLSSHT